MLGCVTAVRLREWRGVKPVACPAGVTITTRLRTTPEDEHILDLVSAHLGRLRRADLTRVCRPVPLDASLDAATKRQVRRDRLNTRKAALTAESSARWANGIIAGNNAQYRLARDGQRRHIVGLRAAIATIEKRLAQPTGDTLTPAQRTACRRAKLPKGYATQAERFAKQRRLQVLRAELGRVTTDWDNGRVHVVEGGKRLAKTRHNLDAANLALPEWRDEWDCARDRVEALGSGDERFGNLSITVTPDGEVSLRLLKPLEHLANAPHSRYILSGRAAFSYRADEWRVRITSGKPLSYTITRKPGRAGRYLTAAWACPPTTSETSCSLGSLGEVSTNGPVVGVDLNDGHLAVRRLDLHGNPVGQPHRIDLDLSGSSARRDAQVRHAITQLLHYTARHRIDTIAVEDLDFVDARTTGRETMGRGSRAKRFRKTVAGIPTAVFLNRLSAQTYRHGVRLFAVNPAYTSVWGDKHWRAPYENVTRHEAAATVIGRRAQGYKARRREGVTRTRPEDRVVRATDQATPNADRRVPVTATGQGCGEPNPACPAGQVRGNWAGQPLPRHRPPTANHSSNGNVTARGEDVREHYPQRTAGRQVSRRRGPGPGRRRMEPRNGRRSRNGGDIRSRAAVHPSPARWRAEPLFLEEHRPDPG
jgi:IS605 OrfB family transposase